MLYFTSPCLFYNVSVATIRARRPDVWGQTKRRWLHFYSSQLSASILHLDIHFCWLWSLPEAVSTHGVMWFSSTALPWNGSSPRNVLWLPHCALPSVFIPILSRFFCWLVTRRGVPGAQGTTVQILSLSDGTCNPHLYLFSSPCFYWWIQFLRQRLAKRCICSWESDTFLYINTIIICVWMEELWAHPIPIMTMIVA